MMIGLPGESLEKIKESTDYISKFNLWGIKIHSLYVMRETKLDEMYKAGKYTPITLEEYVNSAVYMLTHISPKVIIHRLTGDCPSGMLSAPEWNQNKHKIISEITACMDKNGYTQGCLFAK